MDAPVAAVHAAYDNDVERLRALTGQYNDRDALWSAILGGSADVLRHLFDRRVPVNQNAIGVTINTGRADILKMILEYEPTLTQNVPSDDAVTWLTTMAAAGQVTILSLLVPPLAQNEFACRLAAGVAARAGHRDAAAVIQAHSNITVGVVQRYPDLALEIARNRTDQQPLMMCRLSLPQPRLFVDLLNLDNAGSPDALTVHSQLNTDQGFWALQSLRPDRRSELRGLRDRSELTRQIRSNLCHLVGTNLLAYLWARV